MDASVVPLPWLARLALDTRRACATYLDMRTIILLRKLLILFIIGGWLHNVRGSRYAHSNLHERFAKSALTYT